MEDLSASRTPYFFMTINLSTSRNKNISLQLIFALYMYYLSYNIILLLSQPYLSILIQNGIQKLDQILGEGAPVKSAILQNKFQG